MGWQSNAIGVSVCPPAYLKNHTSKFHLIFCTCHLWPWLGPFWQQYSKLFTSGFVDDVVFYMMERLSQNERRRYVSYISPGGGTEGRGSLHFVPGKPTKSFAHLRPLMTWLRGTCPAGFRCGWPVCVKRAARPPDGSGSRQGHIQEALDTW